MAAVVVWLTCTVEYHHQIKQNSFYPADPFFTARLLVTVNMSKRQDIEPKCLTVASKHARLYAEILNIRVKRAVKVWQNKMICRYPAILLQNESCNKQPSAEKCENNLRFIPSLDNVL